MAVRVKKVNREPRPGPEVCHRQGAGGAQGGYRPEAVEHVPLQHAVTVVLPDGRRILKSMDGKSGYLSQSELPLYFGLGDADHAAAIEVRWPSGRRQTVAGPVASGRTIDIVEP